MANKVKVGSYRNRTDWSTLTNRATLNIVVTAFFIAAALLAALYTHAATASDEHNACKDAIEQGYYTQDMYDQCIDDYRSVNQ